MSLIPDLLAPNLRLVFCGTALSAVSYEQKAYYANPGNLFWPTLYRTGITPIRFASSDYPNLLSLGIGLTDLCKTEYGNDKDLSKHALDADALHAKILKYQPRLLAFTSKHAAQSYLKHKVAYGMQKERVGVTQLYVLCSSSGLARGYWKEEIWQQLADLYKDGG